MCLLARGWKRSRGENNWQQIATIKVERGDESVSRANYRQNPPVLQKTWHTFANSCQMLDIGTTILQQLNKHTVTLHCIALHWFTMNMKISSWQSKRQVNVLDCSLVEALGPWMRWNDFPVYGSHRISSHWKSPPKTVHYNIYIAMCFTLFVTLNRVDSQLGRWRDIMELPPPTWPDRAPRVGGNGEIGNRKYEARKGGNTSVHALRRKCP